MKIEDIINVSIIKNGLYKSFLPLLSFVVVELAMFFVFLVVPDEKIMGAVQRIFYFHVASAFVSYLLIAVLLISSILYLVTKKMQWDFLAESANFVAFFFCSIVLVTGMIWGHSAWNTWWRWEPRLVSSLVLWLILFVYMLLRKFTTDSVSQRSFSAVLAIISSLFVPIVIFSIKIMNQNEQLHPQVVGRGGLGHPSFKYALLLASISLIIFSFNMLMLVLANRVLENEVLNLQRKRNIEA